MKMKFTLLASSLLAAAMPTLTFAESAFSGFQAGAALGYQDTDMDWDTTRITSAFDPNDSGTPGSGASASLDDSAFAYGVFGSYNMALNDQWIVGAELAYQGSDTSDSVSPVPGFPGNRSEAEVEVKDTFMLGLKGGYLLNETMLDYSTLSATFTSVDVNSDCPSDGAICNPGSSARSDNDDDNITGWALAVGLEKSLSSTLSVRAEYRYADFGTAEVEAVKQANGESFGVAGDIDVPSQSLMLGAAYRF